MMILETARPTESRSWRAQIARFDRLGRSAALGVLSLTLSLSPNLRLEIILLGISIADARHCSNFPQRKMGSEQESQQVMD
jgi:hypothetical protein